MRTIYPFTRSTSSTSFSKSTVAPTIPKALAWSCHYCNLAKSSNLSGRDLVSGRIVVLFNPRRQRWQRHFVWDAPRLVGLTPCGRATIAVLNINTTHRINLRELLAEAGRFPPSCTQRDP
jgi:hypothetical protein